MCGGSRAWCDREGFAAIHSSIASLVARQAAMAVQDTQITVFHESAVQGGGEGDRPAGVTRFHSFYAELVLSDVGNLFG